MEIEAVRPASRYSLMMMMMMMMMMMSTEKVMNRF